jgi:glycosyltransferase involved in cell wall biosynthesis
MSMNVLLVHDWLTGMRGGEKCLEVLCRHFPAARLFTLLHRRGSVSPTIEAMRIKTSFLQHAPGDYRYWLPLMPRAIESFRVPDDVELVVSLSHAVAKGIRVPPGVRHVCYCFTPMRYAWHLRNDYFKRADAAGGLIGRLKARARDRLLNRLRDWDRTSSRRVDEFVAISRTVAGRIADCYGRESRIVYPPVDTQFYVPAAGPREDFYLCLSALVPYKRIDLAVEACRRLGRRLVVVGSGPQLAACRRLAGPGVEFLGWQPAEVLRELLYRCRALIFPGQEDFGIVPLEAQACGTPVICYGVGGATETVLPADDRQVGTGRWFASQSVQSLMAAVRWFEDHPDQCSSRLARLQAERFTVARFERELLAILRGRATPAVDGFARAS